VASLGGAAIVQIDSDGGGEGVAEAAVVCGGVVGGETGRAPQTGRASPGFWQPHPGGKLLQPANANVWRLTRSLSLGDAAEIPFAPPSTPLPGPPRETAGGCWWSRTTRENSASANRRRRGRRCCASVEHELEWVCSKMTSPLCQGELWWDLGSDSKIVIG